MRRLGPVLLLVALYAPVGAQVAAPPAGVPIVFAADHPVAEFEKTTGYQLYINGVRTGDEIDKKLAWDSATSVVKLTHPGLAAGTYKAQIEAVARYSSGAIDRSRSAGLTFSVGPGTEPPTTPPTLVIPTGLYIRWGDTPPPDDSDEGGLIIKVLPWVTNGTSLSATLAVGAVEVGQPVVVGVSQPGAGQLEYSVTDNLGRTWTRAGVAKFGSGTLNTRGSQVFVAPTLSTAATLSVTATVKTEGVAFNLSAVVLEYGDAETTGHSFVDPDNIATHACGPDPWPMEDSGVVVCLVTLNNNAALTPEPGASLLPGGSPFFAWFANEVEQEDSATLSFTSSVIRRAASVAVRVR